MPIAIIALFCCGCFFGAAMYISVVQHPAALAAGKSIAAEFFRPMYRRAAPIQMMFASVGFAAGLSSWHLSAEPYWLVGAILLISVVPITLFFIRPINTILLSKANSPRSAETQRLLKKWGFRHGWRTLVSGIAFILYLLAAV